LIGPRTISSPAARTSATSSSIEAASIRRQKWCIPAALSRVSIGAASGREKMFSSWLATLTTAERTPLASGPFVRSTSSPSRR
jgi:hypothetical protein